MQKIWVCGARGQIGQAVNDVVDKLEFEMLDTDVDDLDVTDTDEVLRFGEMNRPDIIINCSGMTDISSCEENPSWMRFLPSKRMWHASITRCYYVRKRKR